MTRWKTIRNAPNYEVSEDGDVRNIRTGRILQNDGRANPRVVLMSYGERLTLYVEDLVVQAFRTSFIDYAGEVWRRVNCAWGYEVSSAGNVRNAKTKKVLKPYPNNRTGHPQVTLTDDGYRLTRPVQMLVDEAFGR